MHQRYIRFFNISHERAPSRPKLASTAAATIVVLLSLAAGPVLAATEVRGDLADLQINAQNASVGEILDALSAKFKLTYKLAPGISGKLTGLYSGGLHRALARVLDGNNYFIEDSDGGLVLVVLGASGAAAPPPASQAVVKFENRGESSGSLKPAPVAGSSTPPPPLSTYLSANEPATVGQGTGTP